MLNLLALPLDSAKNQRAGIANCIWSAMLLPFPIESKEKPSQNVYTKFGTTPITSKKIYKLTITWMKLYTIKIDSSL